MGLGKIIVLAIPIILLIIVPGCSMEENNEDNAQLEEEKPGEIEEIEEIALEIMQQVNLIPVIEMPGETVTFEETILGDLLEKEMVNDEEKENLELPENTEEIWDSIKVALTELHQQWDELKPQLTGENISPDIINSFEETMDSLIGYSTQEDHFSTLAAANQLTKYLSKIMPPFAENSAPAAYELKYHTRHILLAAAADNFQETKVSLEYVEELKQGISKDLEEQQAAEMAEKLNNSLDNLQRAVNKQNPDMVKIKAAILMENIMDVIEELEQ